MKVFSFYNQGMIIFVSRSIQLMAVDVFDRFFPSFRASNSKFNGCRPFSYWLIEIFEEFIKVKVGISLIGCKERKWSLHLLN